MNRPWLVLVAVLFCLPLYVGLGRADLRGDEAGHSFSVDRILESGDWLAPKSSPSEDAVFLEKPPLKFWMVAAPIRFGLLPHDEFGLRFWDPLLAGLAFLYVFAIGSRLAGTVAGLVAVLILFVHEPLLFEHGLRGNNMEAALLLSYCGAMYHFLEWTRRTPEVEADTPGGLVPRTDVHAAAVAIYFVLGFMTKFVAAAFAPLVIGAAAVLFPSWRSKVFRHARVWLAAAALALVLIVPWFAYAGVRFGAELWATMFGAHVFTRFTTYLDPTHVHPWTYYFVTMYQQFVDGQLAGWVVGGSALLVVLTIRRRWPEGCLVLLWFALPLGLVSMGTSKLYHYAYPFVPPAALAGGYLAGMTFWLLPPVLERGLLALHTWLETLAPRLHAFFERPVVRRTTTAVGLLAAAIGAVTVTYGSVRLVMAGAVLFRSSGVLRPSVVLLMSGALTGAFARPARLVVLLLIMSQLPVAGYRNVLAKLDTGEHPMRSARDCLLSVEAQLAPTSGSRGLYMDGLNYGYGHEHYYYFRKILPREVAMEPSPGRIYQILNEPVPRPMLVVDSVYADFVHGVGRPPNAPRQEAPVPRVGFTDVVLLLPGPYAVCSQDLDTRRSAP